jgi:AraC-like DNA-binding protein
VRRLAGFFRRARTADGLERESRAVMALSELIRRHTTAPTPALPESVDAAVAARVRDCLGDRLAEPVTLADLETATGVGRFRLLRAFRRRYGLPPHAWRTQKRLAAAQGLIAAGRPIAEAAAETGFADQAHLTRTFRRFLGYTPGRLARAAAA